jgi:hypothetical protein
MTYTQQVLVRGFPEYSPQNLEQDLNFELGIPTTKEPQVPDLDFGQWQHDTNLLLHSLGHGSFDFHSLASNSFKITEEEAQVIVHSTLHKKRS